MNKDELEPIVEGSSGQDVLFVGRRGDDGTVTWDLGPRLSAQLAELRHDIPTPDAIESDGSIQIEVGAPLGIFAALIGAEMDALVNESCALCEEINVSCPELNLDPAVDRAHAIKNAYYGLALPLAMKLHAIRHSSSPAEAKRIRDEALAWLSDAISDAYSSHLRVTRPESHAATLIVLALELCHITSSIPTKALIKEWAPLFIQDSANWSAEQWRKMWILSGLQGLEQGRGY